MFNKKFLIEMLETFFSSIVVLFVLYTFIAMPEMVYGASMEPNFYTGERVLVEKISKYFGSFKRGDIVVLNPPGNNDIDYIKRIVGLPGEIVKIKDCAVYVTVDGNRYKLKENYLADNICTIQGPQLLEGRSVRIEANSYLVLGDNRDRSADSRVFGLVDKDRILGKAIFRFWPLRKVGFL